VPSLFPAATTSSHDWAEATGATNAPAATVPNPSTRHTRFHLNESIRFSGIANLFGFTEKLSTPQLIVNS
jgi:hypothetical protein